ncbi:hypothetical protein, unlikely [Trypanosoma brucei gambiense DAL972]|uniref:Uncharacterized protein n=1 Tax=Trypanosoma brucei gambiense (strain MHOM/CI/86/DAL972) TaxID=679716 RepID=D0A204_TRYB9|nr:hypothetical protein, unlikely [Trypanosoma brucei gambiense DAL972]CBH15297.1 hypothetical protein, unlikely [Trypanosoma brucei gambiense DAL972]|eukprot:XP_011777562.1 hypothetical protein, unlikely [Trypanosoma brucei gambiense DAL972]
MWLNTRCYLLNSPLDFVRAAPIGAAVVERRFLLLFSPFPLRIEYFLVFLLLYYRFLDGACCKESGKVPTTPELTQRYQGLKNCKTSPLPTNTFAAASHVFCSLKEQWAVGAVETPVFNDIRQLK